jgi:hypothetical protein
VDRVGREVARRGWAHVRLERQAAGDLEGFEPHAYDGVILNSVAQYFPGVTHLERVLEAAARRIRRGGFLFVGDVRNLALARAFYASVEIHRSSDGTRREQVRERVDRRQRKESELLLSPSFFKIFEKRLPPPSHVEIRLKRGTAANEMVRFRYDAVLHLGEEPFEPSPEEPLKWEPGMTIEDVEKRLETRRSGALVLSGVPNRRVLAAVESVRWLDANDGVATVGRWRDQHLQYEGRGLDPENFWALGGRLGYQVEVLVSAETCSEYDVTFRSYRKNEARGLAIAVPAGTGSAESDLRGSANDPLQVERSRRTASLLRRYLQQTLPDYMVPASIQLMDRLPLTPHGKIDRSALPKPGRGRWLEEPVIAPATDTERQLAAIWREVLQREQVGVDDNFFDLGGNSLLLVEAQARIQELLGQELAVVTLFHHPTIRSLAASIEAGGASMSSSSRERAERRLASVNGMARRRARPSVGVEPPPERRSGDFL